MRGALVVAGAVLLVASGCSPGEAPDRGRAAGGVVLVIVDTLRSDRLGCFGYPDARTPTLDRLARRGASFPSAVAAVPVTAPSISTILTGAFPPGHGVRDNGQFALEPSLPTLAEAFAGAGHRTGGFVSAAVLDAKYGLNRGFATWDDDVSGPWTFRRPELASQQAGHQGVERRGAETVARAGIWLRRDPGTPFFLLVHLFDPHDPYDGFGAWPGHPYDGEVVVTDLCVRELLRGLEEDGRLGRTLVAVTADHGESLGEHGESTHGFFVYDSTIRVPWIVRGPDLPAGRLVTTPVRQADLAPTLLALAGNGARPGEGRSRRTLLDAAPAAAGDADPAYVENWRVRHSYGWHELESVRTADWKLVRAPRPELYDLAVDPGETRNLYADRPDVAERLEAELDSLLSELVPPEPAGRSLAVDAETRRQLEALGYVSAPDDGADALPDPKDALPGYEHRQEAKALVLQARDLVRAGRADEAAAMLDDAVAKAPDYGVAWFERGNLRHRRGDRAGAMSDLERAVQADPSLAQAWTVLGLIAWAEGRDAEARRHLEAAHARTDAAWGYRNLLEVLLRTGAWEDALRLADARGDAAGRLDHAFALRRAGRPADERAWLRTACPPEDSTVRWRLLQFETGAIEGATDPEAVPAREASLPPPDGDPLADAWQTVRLARLRLQERRPAEALPLLERALAGTAGVHPAYVADVWFLRGRAAAAAGYAREAALFYSKALDDSYGRDWEAEALAGGGRLLFRRD
jgi:arylsulfatase A-like enzyme/tetratricopeptide (TPR) repeat protein